MKRSTLKRGEPLDRRSEMKRSTRLRVLGRRGHEARKALALVRAEVLDRAGHRCERCGAAGRLDLHHRLARSQGGGHGAGNLCCLCRACHDGVTDRTAQDWRAWIETRRGGA